MYRQWIGSIKPLHIGIVVSWYCVNKKYFIQDFKICFLFLNANFKVNALLTNVTHRIETSQFIYIANQLTGFYIMENIGR